MSDWRWDMTSYYTEPLTYINWNLGQPDNYQDKGQDVIALQKAKDYKWADVAHGRNEDKLRCLVCECTDPE